MAPLPAIVVPAAAKHTATLIFMHGLGDSGAGWSFASENFRLRRKFDECAFIFPHAPNIPITINEGLCMPGWFDLASLSDLNVSEDESGMLRSVRAIHELIAEQIDKGVPSKRIVLGGFSQGGAMALLAGLTCEHELGGIIALSSWIPLRQKIAAMRTDANKNISIFQGHGALDRVVRYQWGTMTRDYLTETLGHEVEWHSYPILDHSADPQELDDMEKWLEKKIPNVPASTSSI